MAQFAAAVHWLRALSGTHLHLGGVEQCGTNFLLKEKSGVLPAGFDPGTSRSRGLRPTTGPPFPTVDGWIDLGDHC